ncbi:MAG: hypothetical protein ACEPOW_13285 [Bacteroidales bacterium]
MKKIIFIIPLLILALSFSCMENTEKEKPNSTAAKEDVIHEYCWINDGNTILYDTTNIDGALKWYFTVGDQIEILDQLKTDSAEWYYIQFDGHIKAGYEDLRATNKDLNKSLKGWIISKGTNPFSCK